MIIAISNFLYLCGLKSPTSATAYVHNAATDRLRAGEINRANTPKNNKIMETLRRRYLQLLRYTSTVHVRDFYNIASALL
jgi:hypothetical protein